MTFLGFSKVLSRGVVGVVGLSAIAVLGVPQSAKAVVINAGIDLLSTLDNGITTLPIDGIGLVPLKGNPDPLSSPYFPADTVLERLADCNLMGVSSCTVPLKILSLNLVSSQPVSVPGLAPFNLFIMLNPLEQQGEGTITITDSGTWMASLPVQAVAKLPDGSVVQTFSNTLTGNGTYSSTNPFNPTGIFRGPPVTIDTPTGPITSPEPTHEVVPVPEPSATVPLALIGLAGIWGLKKKHASKQD